jgi:hypothetical protein
MKLKKNRSKRSPPNGFKPPAVIPALGGIQDDRYFWIPPRAGMTAGIESEKIAQFRPHMKLQDKSFL